MYFLFYYNYNNVHMKTFLNSDWLRVALKASLGPKKRWT